ncbi:MAG: MogA/MoaB family molybdenum cofactor biosynthesis protein [Candidatus Krumholzibacteria bacterium]|nr:MogA/MoaB family molybdenum cofactor biosynthesis protein [Candidatus Krumholzibacteria bacterium]
MKVLVLTISDRVSKGVYEDRSGPEIERILGSGLVGVDVKRLVVSDDAGEIEDALERHLNMDAIITTGGTGIGPRDNTPEITGKFCDRLIPGIAEYLRRESFKQTANAVLSRGVAGVKGHTVIVNLPGSVKGAGFCAELLVSLLPHACKMVSGEGH